MDSHQQPAPHHLPTTPPPVSICGARPKSWTAYWVLGAINAVVAVLLLVSIAAGAVGGIFLSGGFLILFGGFSLFQWYAAFSNVGKTFVTASADGIWTRGFELGWHEIRALEFVEGTFRYSLMGNETTVASRQRLCSVVVTTIRTDANGRPFQYGQTMVNNYTRNEDEFRAAVRYFASHVQFRTYLTSSDYTPDPASTSALRQQLSAAGMISIHDRKGRAKLAVDPAGIVLDNGRRIVWADVTGLVALTDVSTSQSAGVDISTRTNRLVVITRHVDPKHNRNHEERPEYREDYQPSIEHLIPIIHQLAPHVAFADRRRISGRK
ncbi:hypothetical protein GTV32_15060 [Gordonia sp. SID5947]|uniref:hypothetical protein n=1 Tax=Gordonia sp. SID5947 TaxID=2690315 RepID=UPI00136EBA7D|nr:hypothetical protein [Gordonia sp. SID5947]MYR07539.1 hypothetical protein [Gordonia sp. SID5947]